MYTKRKRKKKENYNCHRLKSPRSLLGCYHGRKDYFTLTVSALTCSTHLQTHTRSCTHSGEHARTHKQVCECPHTNKGISHGEALWRNHLVAWQQRSSALDAQPLPIAVCTCLFLCASAGPSVVSSVCVSTQRGLRAPVPLYG